MSEPERITDGAKEFELERYKYILQQLTTLNENIHKYLSLFQVLASAIVGGGISVLVGWQSLNISAEAARMGIRSLLALLILLGIFVIMSIIAGVFSWIDYRKEEVALLNERVKPGFRSPPKLSNFWRWHETYLLLFMAIILVGAYMLVEYRVIPLIH